MSTNSINTTALNTTHLLARARVLRLPGLVTHWDRLAANPEQLAWVAQWLDCEEQARGQRSLERRIRAAHLQAFKPLADFDWAWPAHCDRETLEELMRLSFMADATNVMMVGTNGLGKTMLACNLAHQALLQGHTVLFTSAADMLGELAALDSDSALRRRLKRYATPDLLVIDEVGYLSYSSRFADFLFEVISRRYQAKSTIITTNRAFKEWHEVFPNAACVVSLIDRLVHRCEIVMLQGESYRLKEAMARTEQKIANRAHTKAQSKAKKS
jgi:DNA replication protein DnaC